MRSGVSARSSHTALYLNLTKLTAMKPETQHRHALILKSLQREQSTT